MAELRDGCVQPARGPIPPAGRGKGGSAAADKAEERAKEVMEMEARVGSKAPDFEAPAFIAGKGFKPVKLSAYKGKWIVLCFYPGDFTFV